MPVAVGGIEAEIGRSISSATSAPVLSRLGCNAGTCHGSEDGKNGFKLSLRGYDPLFDVRALTDDLASRRVNIASPDDQPDAAQGHRPPCRTSAGRSLEPGEPYYEILRAWIADGAKLDLDHPAGHQDRSLAARTRSCRRIGGKQQMRVVATYADGKTRDVTPEAFVESGNTDVATADRSAA